MSSPIVPGNVKALIEKFESGVQGQTIGKTSNGHEITLQSDKSSVEQKTAELAQKQFEETPNIPSSFPVTPSETPVGNKWQLTKSLSARVLKEQKTLPSEEQKRQQETHQKLSDKLALFSASLQRLKIDKKYKIIVKNGNFDLAKRTFGFRSARSEGTREMISLLREMKNEVIESKNPELLSQYFVLLNDLRATSWGQKLEKNKEIQTIFNELTTSISGAFKEHWEENIAKHIDIALTSTDRKEVYDSLKALEPIKNDPMLDPEKAKWLDSSIKARNTTLLRIDENVFVDHLLGIDIHTEGRNYLLKGAGELVKAEEFVRPIQRALDQLDQMPEENAQRSLDALLDAALALSSLSDSQLDAVYTNSETEETSTLRKKLENIRDKAQMQPGEAFTSKIIALDIMLTQKTDATAYLQEFKNALASSNNQDAFKAMVYLPFLSHSALASPLNPDNSQSKTVLQEMQTVRSFAAKNPNYQQPLEIFDLLLKANSEKVSPITSPDEKTIAGSLHVSDAMDSIRGNRAANRGQLVEALKDDMRAYFASLVSQVSLREFDNLAFSSKDKKQILAPKLTELSQSFNHANSVIVASIVNSKDLNEAKNVIEFYIETLEACRKDGNFYAAMLISSALNSAAVNRIITKGITLSDKHNNLLQKANILFSPEKAYGALREATQVLQKTGSKPIPYIGTLLTDLTFIADGNPNKIDSKVNLGKAQLKQDNVQNFKRMRDNLTVNMQRKTDFFASPAVSEDENWENSMRLLPRAQTIT